MAQDPTILYVCDRKCSTCIFGPNTPLRNKTALQQHISKCESKDAPAECHHGTFNELHIKCRGFYNRFSEQYALFRLGRVLNRIVFVDPDVKELP